MSKPSARESSVPSPYVSLRQAVRPAIFAYSLLATEREQAGALAGECDELLDTTRELLRKLALARLLSPEAGQLMLAADAGGDRQAMLLDAYADAGMLWAEVVGICMAIGHALIEQEQWTKASHLAEVLADAGETASAKELSLSAQKGPAERVTRQIQSVHSAMSPEEISKTLDVLADLPKDFPNLNAKVGGALSRICVSIRTKFPNIYLPRCDIIAKEGCPPNRIDQWFPQVYAEFHRVYERGE